MVFKFLVELVQSGGCFLSKGHEFGIEFDLEFLEDRIGVGVWGRGGGFEAGNVVLEFCLCLGRSIEGITHFLILKFRFLECADEA